MKWFFKALKKYAVFKGRASRKEFWISCLLFFILFVVFLYVDLFTGTFYFETIFWFPYGIFSGLYCLVILIPLISVTVRRLHDIGRSGLWLIPFYISFFLDIQFPYLNYLFIQSYYLNYIIYIVSFLWIPYLVLLIVLMLIRSQNGVNKHGANPKDINEKNKHLYEDYVKLFNQYNKLNEEYKEDKRVLENDYKAVTQDKLEKNSEYLENRKLELNNLKCKMEALEKQINNTIDE